MLLLGIRFCGISHSVLPFTSKNIVYADIDECEDRSLCDANATCFDTFGSYDCLCDDGFVGNGTTCDGIINQLCIRAIITKILLFQISMSVP